MDETTKIKLIYSGELILFAIIFIVLGILQLVGVIVIKEWFLNVFKFLTIAGSAFFIFDFVTSFTNKKKREKVCLADKFSTILFPPYLITIDILLFTKNEFVWNNPQYFIAPLFIGIACAYLFQGIYHWFNPLKELFEDDENEQKDVVDTQTGQIEISDAQNKENEINDIKNEEKDS